MGSIKNENLGNAYLPGGEVVQVSLSAEERLNYNIPTENTLYNIELNGEKIGMGIDFSSIEQGIELVIME